MARRTLVMLVVSLCLASTGSAQDIQTRAVYTVAPVEGGLQFVVGDKTFGPYSSLESTPWFSVDGKAWGMVFRKPDGKLSVLVNGQEKMSSKDYTSMSDVSLSPDGTLWSVRADLPGEGRTRALRIVDGKAYGPFDHVENISWSPAGKGWYFAARTGGSLYVVREGKKYGPVQSFSDWAFDAAGKRLAMVESRPGGSWVRVDDKEYGPYATAEIVRTGNGAYLGYLTTRGNGNRELTIADKKYGPYSYVDWGRQYVSQDGKDWLVMVFRGPRRILLENGKETDLGRLSVYKLAKGWMYTWETGMEQYINFNGKQFGPYETARNLTVTRDGSTWAVSHKRYPDNVEQSFVTVNGTEYSGTGLAYVATGADEYFSWVSGGVNSDAVYQRYTRALTSRTLYSLKTGDNGMTVQAGGGSRGPYAEIAGSPSASPDGAHWGLLARTDGNHFVVLVDGMESGPYGPYARGMDFLINATGAGWSFTAMPDAKDPETVRKIVNGQELGPYAWTDRTWFTQSGKGWYFWSRAAGRNGGSLLTFNGTQYGPWTSDPDRKLMDAETGHFALQRRVKDGVSLQVDNDTSGPYKDVRILRAGERSSAEEGRYFGFVATLKDGLQEIHVQGDKTYGPYTRVGFDKAWISPNGTGWLIPVRKAGNDNDILLQNGTEHETQGFDIRGWAGGYLVFLRQNGIEGFYSRDQYAGPYSGVRGLWVTQDGRTWAAEAVKGDGPGQTSLIVVNGKEYPGERLVYVNNEAQEYFGWFSRGADGSGNVSVMTVR